MAAVRYTFFSGDGKNRDPANEITTINGMHMTFLPPEPFQIPCNGRIMLKRMI